MKTKFNIIAVKNGVRIGYISKVLYKHSNFCLTTEKSKAKGYTSLDVIQGDIDFLSTIGYPMGIIFIYE